MNQLDVQSEDAATREREEKLLREQKKSAGLAENLATREAQVTELTARLKAQEVWASDLTAKLVKLDTSLQQILTSISWRIISPVRKFGKPVLRLVKHSRRLLGRLLRLCWWIVTGQFQRIRSAVWTIDGRPPNSKPPVDLTAETKDPADTPLRNGTFHGRHNAPPSDIVLFTNYFTASTSERQKEIDLCLERNIACREISRIILLTDDGRTPPVSDPKVTVIPLTSRLTYRQWLDLSQELTASSISLLANSDIYFDETIAELDNVLVRDRDFVALTRHDRVDSVLRPHPNPHWSQDVWAFKTGTTIPDNLKSSLDIPLGVPRCDNKTAYLFAANGWQVINPVKRIRAIHVHESQIRTYDKAADASVIGTVAYVHPSDPYTDVAKLDFATWTLSGKTHPRPIPASSSSVQQQTASGSVTEAGVWDDTYVVCTGDNKSASGVPPVIDTSPIRVASRQAHTLDDHFWQYPCLTERDALKRHLKIAEESNVDSERRLFHTYIGLPWATYIDRKSDLRNVAEIVRILLDGARAQAQSRGFGLAVHTVCQHYAWWRIRNIFPEIGITDLHLSHCTEKATAHFSASNIRVHSWPLYAVNVEDPTRTAGLDALKPTSEKRFLASFIGSYMDHYLSDVRLRLAEMAKRDGGPDILFEVTDKWHFNSVVYGEQVKRQTLNQRLVDRQAKDTYRYNEVLSDTVFSLCPEGAGPNSLRLWESLAVGSIPVVVVDDWIPPTGGNGSPRFEDACILLRTSEIDDLFSRLRRMEPSEIEARRLACIDLYNAIKRRLAF